MCKWFSRISAVLIAGLLISCGAATSSCASDGRKSITVMNWNLQTFFDAENDGNEYSEFRSSSSSWNYEKYEERLDRLASVIKLLDCDVVVMEELEKEGQLYDISNRLSGNFDSSKLYTHAFFAKDKGSSIGCGIISRFPVVDATVHQLDIRTESEKQPSMRPVIKCSIVTGEEKVVLFVNHWKSKSGGEDETEKWRDYQENLLCDLMYSSLCDGERNLLALGDFNRDILEFERLTGGTDKNIVLRGNHNVQLYSPWFNENGELYGPGSYFYDGEWNRIDNFFAGGDLVISDFKVQDNGSWTDSEGHPFRYKVYTGTGYSDHMPVTCRIRF